jgi:crossover junction endodeoxyribonuclease RuvC
VIKLIDRLAIGIDISTKTGFSAISASDGVLKLIKMSTINVPDMKGIERAIELARLVSIQVDGVTRAYGQPDVVVIEGYGFANKFSLASIVEIGTLIRYSMVTRGLLVGTMTPNALKKWVSGSGNSAKSKMILEVHKRFSIEAGDDNQADAVGLATAGLAYFSAIKCSKAEAETVGTISVISLQNRAQAQTS